MFFWYFTVNFKKILHLFLVSVAGCFYQQRSKYRQVKITKHTKWVKVQHEKELKNMKVCRLYVLSKHLQSLLRISFCKNSIFIGKNPIVKTISVAINDSSDVLCFDLYLLCLLNLQRQRDAQTSSR